jgi:hypothetical protein
MLDVHPPHHPTHTWTDFFIHIATITVGLLIAVGIEQAVEYFHQHHQLQKAREEIHEELESNQKIAEAQLEHMHAIDTELHKDEALLLQHRAGAHIGAGALTFDWTFRKYRWAAWETNKQSGALDLMPHAELTADAYAFEVAHTVMDSADRWQVSLGTARAIAQRTPEGELTPQDSSELLAAIAAALGGLERTETLAGFEQVALQSLLSRR